VAVAIMILVPHLGKCRQSQSEMRAVDCNTGAVDYKYIWTQSSRIAPIATGCATVPPALPAPLRYLRHCATAPSRHCATAPLRHIATALYLPAPTATCCPSSPVWPWWPWWSFPVCLLAIGTHP
jgi:hypothetical protein